MKMPIRLHKLCGQREPKAAAARRVGFEPDSARVALDDLFTNGESDASARILRPVVQALEDEKYSFVICGIDADAIVGDSNDPFQALLFRADFDARGDVAAAKLECVGHEVVDDLMQLSGISLYRR